MSNTTLYSLTVLIWGSTFFAIEFQLGVVEPEVSLVYRYTAAAMLLFAWSRIRGLSLKFDIGQHGWFAALGLLLFCINYILVYRAQIYISSALTAIAFSSMVWMNIVNSRIFFGVKAGRGTLFGALLGMIGMFYLFAPQIREVALSDTVFFGSCLAIASALVASFGNMISQATQRAKLPVVQTNAWGMLYGSLFTAVFAISNGSEFNFEWTVPYVASLAYLAVFGSVIAFGAYLTLLGRIGASKAGYAMVMFPVVALLLSILFEGLEPNVTTLLGTIFVLAGNALVLYTRDSDLAGNDDALRRLASDAPHGVNQQTERGEQCHHALRVSQLK